MNPKSNPPPAFYRKIFSQIEEIGWENLLRSSDDLSSLTFRLLDQKGRGHALEISLPRNYPDSAPSLAADVPCVCELEWSKNSRLKDVMLQFSEHLQKLQEFWSTMDEIDKAFCVVGPKQSSLAMSCRQVSLGNDCRLLLFINAYKPRSLPECRWFGSDSCVELFRKNWKKNGRKWTIDKPFAENLVMVLEAELPRSSTLGSKDDNEQVDCGICYARFLPIDDELGVNSGSAPDYTCDNSNCKKAFHAVCLRDWLQSISTTRQSFDVLFGNCPYCSEPVAVKLSCCK